MRTRQKQRVVTDTWRSLGCLVVVQELKLAMVRALSSLGNQYIVESLSWTSLILTTNLVAV